MMTLMAGRNAMTPAFTNPTTITVMAVLDCSTPVMSVPDSRPFNGVPATRPKIERMRCTARF
jgi:hypothetical protein